MNVVSGMVERVLLVESQSPPCTMIEFLCETQPEASMLAFELINPPKNRFVQHFLPFLLLSLLT